MDSMLPRGGERIIKTVPGVMRCFKKKIIGRYPRSFLGQGRCPSRVVSLPFLLSHCRCSFSIHHPLANKRTRTTSPQHNFGSSGLQHHHPNPAHQKIQELQQVVQQQTAEIDHLKSENGSLQTQNQKVEHENRILKRAVTIQQDRQHQVNAELEGARTFKEQAEDRIRRLEQMNLTLQYQLQAQNSSAGNDFMGFRPPDVY
eukprot:scaffold16812_cov58-Skeletonema_dohrnii-CCMP3373.AAC.2